MSDPINLAHFVETCFLMSIETERDADDICPLYDNAVEVKGFIPAVHPRQLVRNLRMERDHLRTMIDELRKVAPEAVKQVEDRMGTRPEVTPIKVHKCERSDQP